jgi:hypothetical protein
MLRGHIYVFISYLEITLKQFKVYALDLRYIT